MANWPDLVPTRNGNRSSLGDGASNEISSFVNRIRISENHSRVINHKRIETEVQTAMVPSERTGLPCDAIWPECVEPDMLDRRGNTGVKSNEERLEKSGRLWFPIVATSDTLTRPRTERRFLQWLQRFIETMATVPTRILPH
jgi:hypothetical protein